MASIANISAFKANLISGGSRPNQFSVELTFPTGVNSPFTATAPLKASFLCKAASLPASILHPCPVAYRGRTITLAGEREFDPWTITVYNDNDFVIRNAFEAWLEYINANANNTGEVAPQKYQTDLAVIQYDRNNSGVKSYKFVDAFPLAVSPIELDYELNNVVEQFQVTFAYQYWVSNTTGSTGLGLGLSTPLGNIQIA